jgi:HEAT repeat protein
MTNRIRVTQIFGASVTVVVVLLLIASSASQEISGGKFATFKQLLRERSIGLSKEDLIAALKNSDSHVRYLAALVLAEDKATDTIPAIAEALTTEKVTETKVNIALSLAQLGDERGFAALKEACGNSTLAPSLRMYAAKYLLDVRSESCLSSTEGVLQSTPDVGSRVLALSLLPRFQHVPAEDSEKIFNLLVTALSDKEPLVRIAASHALLAVGNRSAVPPLQKAIEAEHDEAVRSILEDDLGGFERKSQD